MLGIVGALMIGGALFYIVFTTMQAAELSAAEERLGVDWGSDREVFKPPFYIALTRPLLRGAYLDLATGFWNDEKMQRHKKKLVSAGLSRHIEVEHFVASKFWMTVIVGTFLLMLLLFSQSPPPPWLVGGGILFAFFAPNFHLSSTIKRRKLEISFAMPYVVDLLTLSMEAGLDFLGAVAKVVERAPRSPLIEELETVLKDIQLGQTRAKALKGMSERVDMLELSSFVAVIVSADQMGASVGTALRGQSDSMRSERLVRAEKLGAQASQKMLIPLVLFILPAVVLMIFGPIVLSMFGVK